MNIKKQDNVLLVEKDNVFRSVIENYLERKQFNVFATTNIALSINILIANTCKFAIIGSMNSLNDVIDLGRKINKTNNQTRIIFLLNNNYDLDNINQSGIENYSFIVQPFSMKALNNKILDNKKKLIEIKKKANIFHFGKYTFNFNNKLLTYSIDNETERMDMLLTNKESLLLKILIDNLNNITSRQEILTTIWGDDSYRSARSMDVYIAKLRKYLKSDNKISIKNIHAIGFKLVIEN